MRGMIQKAGAVLATLVVAACAGNVPGDTAGGAGAVQVVVQNDGTIPSQVRVYLVPTAGPEIMLGTMSTLGTETLTTRAPVLSGQYRLRAEGGTSRSLNSPVVRLASGDVIVWDMRRNVVQRRQ